VAFMFMTAPVAAHFIARAAYLVGVPMWEESVADELRERYDAAGRLHSGRENLSRDDSD